MIKESGSYSLYRALSTSIFPDETVRDEDGTSASFMSIRFKIFLVLIVCAVVGLICRVFYLSILEQHFLKHEGDERVLRLIDVPAYRGMITDRNGFPLGVSTIAYSAWINPHEFIPNKVVLQKLAGLLQIEPKSLREIIHHNKNHSFTYLKRALSPQIASEIRSLSIQGLYLQQEYRRFYPEGEVLAHVVGFTNIDDHGQEGMELSFNQWLGGEVGKKWVVKDRLGQIISDGQIIKEQQGGHDLTLSIDRRIQYLAYRELMAAVKENQAASGSALVLDAKTGEILAMVNQPSYNPNNRQGIHALRFRNRAVTDLFEPGSTIKAFTVASALKSGKFNPNSIIDTSPGWMRLDHHVVRDERNHKQITPAQILQYSSNMGAAKLALAIPPNDLWDLLNQVGFGNVTGIGFPGEGRGTLVRREPWGKIMLATLSFGYGLSITALQLVHAYSIFANHGVLMPVSLLKLNSQPEGMQVLDAQTADEVLLMLESVLGKGGITEARVEGYRIAGKSGTSRKVGEEGYYVKHYNASFIGIGPVSNPRLIVAVVINDPQGKNYLGGKVAAPAFAKIMEGTLRLLNVPPDEKQI